jgi:peptidoglycan/LPS O-acetylase OafA/YrhL
MHRTDNNRHANSFGLLRLAFAFLVIVSHSFELVDGNRSREPLTYVFGTLSLGQIGVDGFFIVSGYLITKSLDRSSDIATYLWKRVLRIYPGFVVASLACLLIVAPLLEASLLPLADKEGLKALTRLVMLAPPVVPGSGPGQSYLALNGSMWTIAYEFRCYLLIAIVGGVGLLRRCYLFLVATAMLLAGTLLPLDYAPPGLAYNLLGAADTSVQFAALFAVGAAFYLFHDVVVYRSRYALIAAILLCVALFNAITAFVAVAILGGYLIFWFAFLPRRPILNAIGNTEVGNPDISYGVYLYAFPVQMLIISYIPGVSPFAVIGMTTGAAVLLGLASWTLIERPALSLKAIRLRSV